jgi:hypothetical protein
MIKRPSLLIESFNGRSITAMTQLRTLWGIELICPHPFKIKPIRLINYSFPLIEN